MDEKNDILKFRDLTEEEKERMRTKGIDPTHLRHATDTRDGHESFLNMDPMLGEVPSSSEEVITTENTVPVLDEKNPLNPGSEAQLAKLMKQMRDIMGLMESHWKAAKEEFKLTDTHMKSLYQFNEEHRDPPPEGNDPDESTKGYDQFNGLNKISEEKVLEIFGKGHPIIAHYLNSKPDPEIGGSLSVQYDEPVLNMHQVTIDRIKSVVMDFFNWLSARKEYSQIYDGYMRLIEAQEDDNLEALRLAAEKEEDPEKRIKMQESVELYYNRKYLDFLAEPLDEIVLDRLIKAFSDSAKIEYWISRARTRLKQLGISDKVILEISQFEKRFLPEEYHSQSNILLLYFLSVIAYTDAYDKKGDDRVKVVCMVYGLDKFIRNVWDNEIRERIMNNVIAFQEQFMGKLPKAEVKE